MAVFHVVGRLGSGKSLYCVQRLVDALVYSDKHIYTNVRLKDFWDLALAKWISAGLKSFTKFLISPMRDLASYRLFLAKNICERYHYIGDLSKCVDMCFELGPGPESSRLLIWDEIHLELNSRDWKRTSGKMIQFFSMSRKLGFDILMISQIKGAVDRQLRDLADQCFTLKNLRNLKPFGLKIFPPVGLLSKRWGNTMSSDDKGMLVGAGIVRYNSSIAEFYDTKQILTDKTLPPPQLWSATHGKGDKCFNCNYQQFYIEYRDFIENFYPEDMKYLHKLPCRLMNKELVKGLEIESAIYKR